MLPSIQSDDKLVISLKEAPDSLGQETKHNNNVDDGLTAQEASDYHAMATVAELLVTLRNENQKNQHKNEKQQYTNMEFVDKKTGEVMTQRVLF
jgi:hypothetical protein